MPPFGETIAVIDKSGQVVSTSKHLFGVFNQAKNAYRERKAQVQSERNAKIAERQALKALQNYSIDDSPSVAPSRRSHGSRHHHSGRRHHHSQSRGGSVYEQDLHSPAARRAESATGIPAEMVRRHTHHDITVREPPQMMRPVTARSRSDAHVDMDLAYGDFHPSALSREPSPQHNYDQQLQQIEDPELNGLVGRAQWLLEEANCLHHSANTTIDHLQKNPDAMAAVALTLAEISNLVTKMAPAALTALKTAAPSIFALLASPQFLIAAGVGLGATIVMFGGYKIIKQITGSNNNNNPVNINRGAPSEATPEEMDDMMEFNTDCLSSVEMWRRGVADAEAGSVGTSVDGEFITPTAAAMSGIDVTTARLNRDPRFKFDDDQSRASSRRSRRSHASRSSRAHQKADTKAESTFSRTFSRRAPKASSQAPSRAPSRAPSTTESRLSDKGKKPKEKPKRSSRLRLMFMS